LYAPCKRLNPSPTIDSHEPFALAQRGDIVMSGGLLGICWGAVLFAVGREGEREGLVRIDRRAWVEPLAWRVQYGG
jgi:hypothetical protein